MPTTVLEELQRIYKRDGVLKPEAVVEEARPEHSPLHDRFEWDDSIAAERYRREQAGDLIRKVHVDVRTSKGATESVRAFVNLQSPGAEATDPSVDSLAGYFSLEDVIQDSERRELLVLRMKKDFQLFKKRYDVIADLVNEEIRLHLDETA
jgi:hypothetical protein